MTVVTFPLTLVQPVRGRRGLGVTATPHSRFFGTVKGQKQTARGPMDETRSVDQS